MSFFVLASAVVSLFGAPSPPPLALELSKPSALAAASPVEDNFEPCFKPRHGVTTGELNELKDWLGPQYWKLADNLSVLCIELFAGHGQVEPCARRHGHVVICLGLAHGQDLSEKRAPRLVQTLIRLTKPVQTHVAWPCKPYSPMQRINLCKGGSLAARVLKNQVDGLKLVELFFVCWQEQVPMGRHCTGENPQQSIAFDDVRFADIDAHWALLHQCQVGLFNLDGKGCYHKKPTWFVSSSKNIMCLNLTCSSSH